MNKSVSELINSTRLQFFPNGSVEISELAPEDEALYSCSAINLVGMDIIYMLVIYEDAYRFCEWYIKLKRGAIQIGKYIHISIY